MKKHLQFNDITALSLGWRAARRKAERERRVEREKEQSSSSLLCIFIKENITSFLLLFSFLFLFAFLSHSFTFFLFSPFLSSVHFYLFLPLPQTRFLSPPPHPPIVSPYSSIWPIQFLPIRSCLSNNVSFFFFFPPCCTLGARAHSQQDCWKDYNVSFQSATNLLAFPPSPLSHVSPVPRRCAAPSGPGSSHTHPAPAPGRPAGAAPLSSGGGGAGRSPRGWCRTRVPSVASSSHPPDSSLPTLPTPTPGREVWRRAQEKSPALTRGSPWGLGVIENTSSQWQVPLYRHISEKMFKEKNVLV